MGDPKATDIPAAAAAERISRFRATFVRGGLVKCIGRLTFITIQGIKRFEEQIRTATRYVD
jgi:hypothetical protein